MFSWREVFFAHMFKDGVIANEYDQELSWARNRKRSMFHAFGDAEAVEPIIEHYGLDQVSWAKDSLKHDGTLTLSVCVVLNCFLVACLTDGWIEILTR